MPTCPACGFDNAEPARECPRCHLSAELFQQVRDAAGSEGDPRYLQAIGDILQAVDAGAETSADAPENATPSVGEVSVAPTVPPEAAPGPPGLPALPRGGDVRLLLRQVNEYLQIARRQGLPVQPFGERAREGVLSQDRESLEALSRELFIHLAAALTGQYEALLGRRTELAGLIPVAAQDAELEGCRASLALGDLAGAQRRLRHLDEEFSTLEEEWATVQILVAEADLIAATIRELGGDPTPGLGPLTEGRRLAEEGNREAAEPVLARGTLALWSILDPLFVAELGQIKVRMVAERASGADLTAPIATLRQLAADLRHRNFASAISAYRHLRARPAPPALAAPPRA